MKKIFTYLIFAISFSLLINSCNTKKSLQGELVNQYANKSRNNNYERFGNFYYQLKKFKKYSADDSSGAISSLLSLSSYQTVFPSVNRSIILLGDKKKLWSAKLDSDDVVAAGMVADKKQNIYAISNTGYLYSFSIKGKRRWKKLLVNPNNEIMIFTDLLALEKGIIAGATNGTVAMFSYSGELIWKRNFGLAFTKYFPADDSGNFVLPLTHNIYGATDTLMFIDSDGKILWKKYFQFVRFIKAPIIGKNKIYIIGEKVKNISDTKIPYVFAFDTKGNLLWKKEFDLLPRFLSLDNKQRLYVSGYNSSFNNNAVSMIKCLDTSGNQIWVKYFDVSVASPILISDEIIAFVGANANAYGIYFLSKEGSLLKMMPLTDGPAIRLQPSINPIGNLLFPCANKLQVLKIDESAIGKIIPW